MIPEGWIKTKLESVSDPRATIRYGVVQIGADTPEGVPIVPIKYIDQINRVQLHRAAPDIERKYKNSRVQTGDVLISVKGTIGEVGIVPKGFDGNIAREIARIRPNEKAYSSYIAYQLQAADTQRRIKSVTVGTTRLEFSIAAVKSFEILLPPRREQLLIIERLETWDRAIKTVEALMQQLLPQGATPPRKRLPGFSGEWREVRLGDLVEEVSRDVDWDDDATYKLISVRRRSEGIFHRESLSGHEILTKSMKVARAGDFLVSKMQIVHGASALVKQPFDGFSISGSYIALIPKDHAKLDIEFFDWYSRTPYFYKLTYISSYGVHIEKMTFNLKSFLKKTILVPSSKAEQSAIVVQLNSAEALIGEHQQQAAALRREKAALMQQLLTGKRRVKVNDEEITA